jgi:hypothetical protein
MSTPDTKTDDSKLVTTDTVYVSPDGGDTDEAFPKANAYNQKLNHLECSTGVLVYNGDDKEGLTSCSGTHLDLRSNKCSMRLRRYEYHG